MEVKMESMRNRYKENLDNMKTNYDNKLNKVENDKEQLKEIVKDLEFHNKQLSTVVSCKTKEIKEYLRRVEN